MPIRICIFPPPSDFRISEDIELFPKCANPSFFFFIAIIIIY